MAKNPRLPEDDDGRTIADMSGVSGPSLFTFRRPEKPDEPKGPSGPQNELSRKEKLMFMLGALKASFLVVGAYVIGLGLVILLMLFLWR